MSRASRAAQRRQDAKQYARLNTEIWFPKARDLALLDVPDSERPRIRKRLAPWLANLKHGVKSGWCWKLAQILALSAQQDDVKYVEGVWNRTYDLESGERPAPHAWVTVEGYRVDVLGEFYSWRSGDNELEYEPLKEYSQTELTELASSTSIHQHVHPLLESFDLSTHVWSINGGYETLPDHLKDEPEFKTHAWDEFREARYKYEYGVVFKPAIDRLLARHNLERAA